MNRRTWDKQPWRGRLIQTLEEEGDLSNEIVYNPGPVLGTVSWAIQASDLR